MSRSSLKLVFCLLPAASFSAMGAEITLDSYLKEVATKNETIRASRTTLEAGELRSSSTDIIYTPQLFSQVAHTVDKKEPRSPLEGEKTEATSVSVGVQKLWVGGLQTQLTYTLNKISLELPQFPSSFPLSIPMFPAPVQVPIPLDYVLPRSEFAEARTQLDVSQPLLKNSQGREHELTRETAQTKIEMQKSGELYKQKAMLAQAEYVYWQLALAQEAVRNQEASLSRFKKLRAWAQRRANMQLGDRADVLQAESGLRFRAYELETAKKDRNAAERAFNTMRGKPGDEIEGELAPIRTPDLQQKPRLEGAVKRLDIEVAKKQQRISEIEVEQNREKFSSQLDLFGSVALNTLDDEVDEALKNSFKTDHPTYVVGLKFSMPLDRDLINKERSGLIRTSQAAGYEVAQKEFSAQQEWDDLQKQLDEAQMRLRLANELEASQREKLNYERQRLEIGRTTTYQILMFEQDYSQSQLATIKAKADILGILARLKSFGDRL